MSHHYTDETGPELLCVEVNCGGFMVNEDEGLCQWHNENRTGHLYTDETGTKWPFPCSYDDRHAGPCDGGEWKPGRFPKDRRPEGSCGILSDRQDCFDWCPLEYAHHGPHKYTQAWSPLPKPVRRIVASLYWIGQAIRYAMRT